MDQSNVWNISYYYCFTNSWGIRVFEGIQREVIKEKMNSETIRMFARINAAVWGIGIAQMIVIFFDL